MGERVPKPERIGTVLLLGSGAIKIGEAGEFDYSGAQAIKALREEGTKVVLVNPNIATIQSDPKFVDRVYSVPVTAEFLEEVIEKERPDGILLGFGGQTALNAGVDLHERGVLSRHGVRVLGTGIEAIETADDRGKFRRLMVENGVPVPKSRAANSVGEAQLAAREIGFPVMVRVAYTLGGQGSGVARNASELESIVSRGLAGSRIGQVLVEEYLDKWKEVEYEVMRDSADNCAIICNMENFDPMGVHTGDSIVVAPSQTLSNREYHALRTTAFKIVRALGIVGECNIQFALNPRSEEFRVIELNSRLSRSSALASKATGYPIAYVAAKLAIGYNLPELPNKVTGKTTAFFEPALDYVTVKIPRWDFQKFKEVSRLIGTQMKSVGEVMAVGRRFEEAIQKAVRMLDIGRELTEVKGPPRDLDELRRQIEFPTDKRLFDLVEGLRAGLESEEIHRLSGIDPWFLCKLERLLSFEKGIVNDGLDSGTLKLAKQLGYSDRMLGILTGTDEVSVRSLRESQGVLPSVKQIDTLAAEWPAVTNYLYLTYNGESDDIRPSAAGKVLVLGSGCYRIGSSVEFDWCCVNMALSLKEKGAKEVIMLNYNPETVSTDYDVPDRLYFEELTLERVLDIIEKEKPEGVVVSVGGQIPNNLALRLAEYGVSILGTSAEDIDRAEDRAKFSSELDVLAIPQPPWRRLESLNQARVAAADLGYPVLIRPSYVLSGSAMQVANDEAELSEYLEASGDVSEEHPVVMSKFFDESREVEVDAVSDGENVYIGAVLEHVEEAGIHSGDATISIPTITIGEATKNRVRAYTRSIAKRLKIRGPFNIQFLCKNGEVYVIECNVRSSRSMPFVSKSVGVNLMEMAAGVFLGGEVLDGEADTRGFAVKSPQFSFMRLEGADPVTSVDMVSTGEVACFGASFEEAFLKSLLASGFSLPKRSILLSTGPPKTKEFLLPTVKKLEKLGFELYATKGTARFLREKGIETRLLYWPMENAEPNASTFLSQRRVDLVINIPKSFDEEEVRNDYLIRRKAVEFGIPIITNAELATTLVSAMEGSVKLGI
ncbi:MAG TPA: carbamoyl-phosphate synthase (glutamine-hydrolyzing) large subunit [Nitrososphaerales archaeon]|nr:carbamoyl-phosphate synthase (glutamine-hydrolyzing) large subunit [Nitrososphaerales archaeon]